MLESKNIIIVGGGHAGIEAALIIAKLGYSCSIVTHNKDSIGRLSCNPAIGGLAKGHLVKEIDALGGFMGMVADRSTIQNKILNKSKGRAVWSPRSQVDKIVYTRFAQDSILSNKNINIIKGEVVDFKIKNNAISKVMLSSGKSFSCNALIITSGTFMEGLIHIGDKKFKGGRMGEKRSSGLTASLKSVGFSIKRLKTGTPPRILSSSVDWSKLTLAPGEGKPQPFSLFTKKPYKPKNIPCYLAYTTKKTHQIIKNNINLSAMFSGQISGVGPRYCPSIEDKVMRFNDKPQHQLFLEPEWEDANQIYINGFPTSLPESVQIDALRSIDGLASVELIRPGYAIEYDYFPSHQLKSTLETKKINGLYFAGQINGTSGYEEAAAQGLVAGINVALKLKSKDPLILKRSESYIGVMIDDLITKSINEPYRMFTSRAENRLSLRADTAHFRLGPISKKLNLFTSDQLLVYEKYLDDYNRLFSLVNKEKCSYNEKSDKVSVWLKRPNVFFGSLSGKSINKIKDAFGNDILFCVETAIKYEGYEIREKQRNKKIKSMESNLIPKSIDYNKIQSLSNESREKLNFVKPETLGQASRIDGVRSSDLAILSIYLTNVVSRETT